MKTIELQAFLAESTIELHVLEQWIERRWIVPPQASGVCDVFHLKMRDFHPLPNYYVSDASDGGRLLPWYGDQPQTRLARAAGRVRRRLKLWKRMEW